jgi:hypothetical protein
MALLQETFTETLDAGAPSIKYEGDIQQEQKIARTLWDQLPNQVRMRFGSFEQFFSSGAWKKVLEAVQQQQQMEAPEQIQEAEVIQEQAPQQGLGSTMPAPMAGGGIAGIRQPYFLGKLVKKITKPFKKIAKSPVGKAALMYAATAGLGNLAGGLGGAQPWMRGKWLLPKNVGANLFGKAAQYAMEGTRNRLMAPETSGLLGKLKLTGGGGSKMPTALGWGALSSMAPLAMSAAGKWDTGAEEIDSLKNKAAEFGFDYSQMIQDIQNAVATGSEEEIAKVMTQYNLSRGDMPGSKYIGTAAEGGRIGLHEGGDPFYGEGESYWEHRYDDPKKWWGGPHMSEWFEERHSTGPEGKPHSTPKGRQSEGLFRLMEYAKEKERRDLLGRMGRPGQRGRKEIPGQDVAQGGRIGYAEGGWEAREKQDLISRLVRMGLPLPQAMKMAEMIIANATPQELQRTLRGTRSQGLTPEESINFQENITAPGVDIQEDETITDHMSKVYPLPKSVQAQPVSLSGAKPDMRAAMMGWARPSQALIDRMQRAPDEFRRRMQRAPYEVEVEEEISPYGAAEGGLMSLGGMEMDLRGGGFVPIGKVEKADDVPARLSKNEFVFTADAVRAAGNGNVDAGADKMYKTMKQLENRVGS